MTSQLTIVFLIDSLEAGSAIRMVRDIAAGEGVGEDSYDFLDRTVTLDDAEREIIRKRRAHFHLTGQHWGVGFALVRNYGLEFLVMRAVEGLRRTSRRQEFNRGQLLGSVTTEDFVRLTCSKVELLPSYPLPRRTRTEDAEGWWAFLGATQSVGDGREHHTSIEDDERVVVVGVKNDRVDPERHRACDPEVIHDIVGGPGTVIDAVRQRAFLPNLFAIDRWIAPLLETDCCPVASAIAQIVGDDLPRDLDRDSRRHSKSLLECRSVHHPAG